MTSFQPPGYCPNCGEYVEERLAACPSCGSCAQTGWNDDAAYDGLDLPYERDEKEAPEAGSRLASIWKGIAVFLLLGILVWALLRP